MRIYVRVKTPGRRRDALRPVEYDIPDEVKTLRELLCAAARTEAKSYNAKKPGEGRPKGITHLGI